MDLDALALLVDGEGWDLLASLPPYDPAGELALQTRLRAAGYAPELVSAALTQSMLRARAREKFGAFADQMLFTPDGLEQATRLAVAARHAARYLRAEVRLVHDLGCGIGADAMGFAGLDLAVRAVDADPVTAVVATLNLRHWPDAVATHGRAEDVTLPEGEAVRHTGLWLDPARRTRGPADITGRSRRVFSLDAISPPWSEVLRYAAAVPATGAKLAPGFPHQAVPDGAEAQWVSWQGDVVECAVWWGPLVTTAGRTAMVLRPKAEAVTLSEADATGARPALERGHPVGRLLYEPDRAVIRAGLTGALARLVDGAELSAGVGYVTSARVLDVPWAHRYAVREALPWNVKAVRGWLRDRGIGHLTIKKRGVSLDPDAVRQQLRPTGDSEATLVLTRVGSQPYALVVDPA
ncbi:MAG: class I SAM-dependent methyltransferase [Actinomycetota bacterium]|nr:class I SAM-dependent methyltransferase [Actinomycetota bacterium]